jgi:hydroxymethylbilane synthase
MKKQFKIICRNSKLSLIQGHTAQQLIEKKDPSVSVEVLSKPSRGDLDLTTPLYLMGDKNIFTKDIEDVLWAGEADFAVHSMKDISAEKLTDPNFKVAIIERDDVRDVVIFNQNIFDLLRKGDKIRLGTSSLRREQLIPVFLKKALPKLSDKPIEIEILSIRGNVDTRLRKLINGDFDCIALAVAGLNRLLNFDSEISEILRNEIPILSGLSLPADKVGGLPKMLMPIAEVTPAAGQGALLVECLSKNEAASTLIQQINDPQLLSNILKERDFTKQYGAGCHQRFGVVNFDVKGINVSIIKGKSDTQDIDDMDFDTPFGDLVKGKKLFSASDYMRDFFDYQYFTLNDLFYDKLKKAKTIFVAHHRAASDTTVLDILKSKNTENTAGGNVWASGTKTWFDLAKKGVWVEGCSDGFGFEFLNPVFERPLFKTEKKDILILTNEAAEAHWQPDYKTASTYRLTDNLSPQLIAEIKTSDAFFWTNYEQYQICKPYLKPNIIHACPSGKTAQLFENEGLTPVLFPNIKAFLVWKSKQNAQNTEGPLLS